MDSQIFTSDKNLLNKNLLRDGYSTDRVFSTTDMVAYVTLPGEKTYTLGSLNLLSISTHRDKFPVTSLGSIKPKGFTGGHRYVGGTLVFATFDRSIWHGLINARYENMKEKKMLPYDTRSRINRPLEMFLPDELPPFDISVTFVNESGIISYTGVLGATILDEGETYDVNQINIMESFSYIAKDRIPFQPLNPGNVVPDTEELWNFLNTNENLR